LGATVTSGKSAKNYCTRRWIYCNGTCDTCVRIEDRNRNKRSKRVETKSTSYVKAGGATRDIKESRLQTNASADKPHIPVPAPVTTEIDFYNKCSGEAFRGNVPRLSRDEVKNTVRVSTDDKPSGPGVSGYKGSVKSDKLPAVSKQSADGSSIPKPTGKSTDSRRAESKSITLSKSVSGISVDAIRQGNTDWATICGAAAAEYESVSAKFDRASIAKQSKLIQSKQNSGNNINKQEDQRVGSNSGCGTDKSQLGRQIVPRDIRVLSPRGIALCTPASSTAGVVSGNAVPVSAVPRLPSKVVIKRDAIVYNRLCGKLHSEFDSSLLRQDYLGRIPSHKTSGKLDDTLFGRVSVTINGVVQETGPNSPLHTNALNMEEMFDNGLLSELIRKKWAVLGQERKIRVEYLMRQAESYLKVHNRLPGVKLTETEMLYMIKQVTSGTGVVLPLEAHDLWTVYNTVRYAVDEETTEYLLAKGPTQKSRWPTLSERAGFSRGSASRQREAPKIIQSYRKWRRHISPEQLQHTLRTHVVSTCYLLRERLVNKPMFGTRPTSVPVPSTISQPSNSL
jgi:hypothetical protein